MIPFLSGTLLLLAAFVMLLFVYALVTGNLNTRKDWLIALASLAYAVGVVVLFHFGII